jgi:transmembrane 9 superfamily member 2/4
MSRNKTISMTSRMVSWLVGLLIVVICSTSSSSNKNVVTAFYVPGIASYSFSKGEDVPLKVNKLTSTHTQVPRDYYRLPYCTPINGTKMVSENLGEFLSGDKIQNSPYVIQMLNVMECEKICKKTLNKLDNSKLKLHIKYG